MLRMREVFVCIWSIWQISANLTERLLKVIGMAVVVYHCDCDILIYTHLVLLLLLRPDYKTNALLYYTRRNAQTRRYPTHLPHYYAIYKWDCQIRSHVRILTFHYNTSISAWRERTQNCALRRIHLIPRQEGAQFGTQAFTRLLVCRSFWLK